MTKRWSKSEEDKLISLRKKGCSYKEIAKQLNKTKSAVQKKYYRLTDSNYVEKDKQYYQENKDKIAEYKKQYREDNKEKMKEYHKQYYQDNRDKLLEHQRKYNKDNKDKIAEYQKQYRQDNKDKKSEYNKQYYQDNRDKLLEHQKQYYQDNRDKIAEYKKQHYEDNRDKILEHHKQYYQDNRDKLLERQRKYNKDNRNKIAEYKKQYYEDRIDKLIQYYSDFDNIPIQDLEYLKYIPNGDRILETEFKYIDFGNASEGYERHHIIPYHTCIHYRDLCVKYTEEWIYWNNKACNRKNSIDLPIKLHKMLHSKLTEYGYGFREIIPLEKFDEYEALVFRLIDEVNKELYNQGKLDSY